MGTEVVNIYTERALTGITDQPAHWPTSYVYIGRAGRGHDGYFGNPFPIGDGTPAARARSLNQYGEYFQKRVNEDPEFRQRVLELRGKTLVCFCAPKECHGDTIITWLNRNKE